jgi:murein DD-endopeptidase
MRIGIGHCSYGSLVLVICSQLAGCGTSPVRDLPLPDNTQATATGKHIVSVARKQLGAPYHYGGATPRGFDCSGLVYYVYKKVGIQVPRTTEAQLHSARPVSFSQLEPGDIVFFRVSWKRDLHVAIYAGNGRFIHAPTSGKPVSYGSLYNPYWREHIAGAGRLY